MSYLLEKPPYQEALLGSSNIGLGKLKTIIGNSLGGFPTKKLAGNYTFTDIGTTSITFKFDTEISVVCIGGGGGGGGYGGTYPTGCGGGGGALCYANKIKIKALDILTVTVGSGGSGGGSVGGGSGGASYVTLNGVELIRAGGGSGGLYNSGVSSGGTPSGSIKYTGFSGASGILGGAGGGAGGFFSNGYSPAHGENKDIVNNGIQISSGSGSSSTSNTGELYGGGGMDGVGGSVIGSNGANGAVRIIYGKDRAFPNVCSKYNYN